ncbi:MAG: anthranilate synthase component I family protein [Polyangiaceae bacterium]|nr:anthranilate synthase component I family protein [Polyangiaceae bacterium]
MPVVERTLVVDGITPVGAYAALRGDADGGSFLLESVVPGERWGRYSILGVRPARQVVLHPETAGDPFERLAELTRAGGGDEHGVAARLATSHFGVVSYDAVHSAFKVDPWPDARAPIVRMIAEPTVVVFDNLTHTATVAGTRAAEVERAVAVLSRAPALAPRPPPNSAELPDDVEVDTSDQDYQANVERVKEHILAGDAFQVVVARTFSVPARGADAFDVYRALRVLSPAPYMYCFELPAHDGAPAVQLAGASPETLVRVEGSTVTVRPIAGTRRRGKTLAEDQVLAEEMLSDPKELAEHVMLIDLARNDVGRVSRAGTVRLEKRMVVERFSHVMHIVREVAGELVDSAGPWDVLCATFPAGTLTGAPKVRAMQLIRELELRPRGVYGGAVGYVTADRDLDFAIAIRTVVLRDGRFEVSAGAGIVADSVPELEAKETRNKARAGLAAVNAARRARERG